MRVIIKKEIRFFITNTPMLRMVLPLSIYCWEPDISDPGCYLPVPKRDVSMSLSLGLKPLKRQMNVSLRLRVMSRVVMR